MRAGGSLPVEAERLNIDSTVVLLRSDQPRVGSLHFKDRRV